MRALFSLPNPVNEASARLAAGAGTVAVLSGVTLAFQQGRLTPARSRVLAAAR
jgi:hypothetical protein